MTNTHLMGILAVSGSLLVAMGSIRADEPRETEASGGSVNFGGTTYHHRWSKAGQHEYTPARQEDLATWRDMLTINVHETVTDGDGLASLANAVVERYASVGEVLGTSSEARTESRPAEHFIVAVLPTADVVEIVFARFLLRDGVGYVVVYSHRIYDAGGKDDVGAWLRPNGRAIEKRLMEWQGVPSLASLKALPQS